MATAQFYILRECYKCVACILYHNFYILGVAFAHAQAIKRNCMTDVIDCMSYYYYLFKKIISVFFLLLAIYYYHYYLLFLLLGYVITRNRSHITK